MLFHGPVAETFKFISCSQCSCIFHSILKLPGIRIHTVYSFTCNLIFTSISHRGAYCKCQQITYYGKLISYVIILFFREKRLLILVGLLEHYEPFEVLQHFGIFSSRNFKATVQIISQSSGIKRIILFNSGINSTLSQMNIHLC